MTITNLDEKRSERHWQSCANAFNVRFTQKLQGDFSLFEVFSKSGRLEYTVCVGNAGSESTLKQFNRYCQHYRQSNSGFIGLLSCNIHNVQRQYDMLAWFTSLWADAHYNSASAVNPAMMSANIYYPKWLKKLPGQPLINFLLGKREVHCGLGFTRIDEQWLSAFSWFSCHQLNLPVFEILRDVTQHAVADIHLHWLDETLTSVRYEKHVINRSQWGYLQTQFFEQYPLETF